MLPGGRATHPPVPSPWRTRGLATRVRFGPTYTARRLHQSAHVHKGCRGAAAGSHSRRPYPPPSPQGPPRHQAPAAVIPRGSSLPGGGGGSSVPARSAPTCGGFAPKNWGQKMFLGCLDWCLSDGPIPSCRPPRNSPGGPAGPRSPPPHGPHHPPLSHALHPFLIPAPRANIGKEGGDCTWAGRPWPALVATTHSPLGPHPSAPKAPRLPNKRHSHRRCQPRQPHPVPRRK